MTQQEVDKKLSEELVRRERETEMRAAGVHGVCVAGIAAPDCIVVVQWIGAIEIPYCLN